MSITVPVHLGYEFEVKAKAADVFAVLADVPLSASHFPKVHQLTDLGGGAYRWEMEKVGTEHINIQTMHTSQLSDQLHQGLIDLALTTDKDLETSIAEGYDSLELLKRYSTISMGPCQGKMCSQNTIHLCARAIGRTVTETGTTTARPPGRSARAISASAGAGSGR